jgi:hypothetical protein
MSDGEIPSWEQLEAGFAKLEALLAQNPSQEEVLGALNSIPLSDFHCIRLKCEFPKSVFRARRPKAHENLGLVSTFAMPRPMNTPTGRANREQHPVFYASLLTDTAIQEILPEGVDFEKDGLVYVGEWRPNAPFNMKQLLVPAHALKNEVVGNYHYGLMQSLREMLKPYSAKNQITLERLAGRIGDYFLRSKDDFRVSSELGHQALYQFTPPGGFQVDAIVYPSRVKDHAAINFAFGARYAADHLDLVEVRKYRVTNASMEGSHVKLIAVALPEGKRLKWYIPQLDFKNLRVKSMSIDAKPGDNISFDSQLVRINGVEKEFDALLKEGWDHRREQLIQKAVEELIKHPFDEIFHSVEVGVLIQGVPIVYQGVELEALQLRYDLTCRWILHPEAPAVAA